MLHSTASLNFALKLMLRVGSVMLIFYSTSQCRW